MESFNSDYTQAVGFNLENETYGIDILNVSEIIKPINITFIPNTLDFVLGVINLRGKIIPIVDLNKKFFDKFKDITQDSRIIVVSVEDNTVGFLVDRIKKIYHINNQNIENSPETVNENVQKYIKGVGKLDEALIILLDVNTILKEGGYKS
ncbi:MAG: chemotaxis protein CheW [Desulfurella sp.]|jgi:purine-binding chemotaxis protein CheW|uniref:Purine-binding chemotaxis protein CheW n=1 Tax=Desulfurella multipotens TaxID=79269 RepID=A0A1G6HKP0_9BACT|nr:MULTISPECIES: chemotaxis protein CheW [Desulfurella]AHF97312.1 chemotaxis protein CheW [Desulfurella acetivorans A63]HEX13300.1 purine-binding chemotaxis protein CheW [Desulfurella acetivorans]PMP65147.1 MAG: chemotaxis protein CheW [Desulfurella multipotens]PMP68421.1 MAG: chemotaxis protein CheW [Desulfurella multipotens]PMP68552.1 MAG: chemotaxis protein CheW [Desulfurella multipotens]